MVGEDQQMSRLSARDRLGRMLELVPWVMSQGGAEIDEIARRFDYPSDELREDLSRVLFMVGLYPFTPDQLINVIELDTSDDNDKTQNVDIQSANHQKAKVDRIAISNAEYFSRPLRLTPAQALSLIGAAKALLTDTHSDSPLTRGLDKLASGLKMSGDEDLKVNLGDAPQEWIQTLLRAVQNHLKVQIRYFSYGRGQITDRIIQPHRVFSETGNLYVRAHCEWADGIRVFLIDRIKKLHITTERFDPPDQTNPPSAFQPRDEDPRVVLELAPEAAWVLEKYPVEYYEQHSDGNIQLTMPVSEVRRLEVLLLQLGTHAVLQSVEGALRMDLPKKAAQRVLRKYL
ncbi:MAG: WYL domain-containing protein [Acidimicrobiia bacterium]|nr:WYL domain-containing protein [Acidimicrobiia bacterium]MYC58481.1 WYL domain-containing protein [Acidimicrobiia bacterium]MYI30413.1 WYL domain-containing protein [Acidimicrobiia bacterium]